MEQKKIATAVDIMIRVANYEYIHITKYSEKNISYESKEDMVGKEDVLSNELMNDIIRTMRAIPDRLGKKTNAIVEIEEKIQKRMPEWLENGPEPNIANTAKINHEEINATLNAEANDKKEESKQNDSVVEDLFDDKDSSPKEVKEELVPENKDSKSEDPKSEALKTDDFGADDLFSSDEDLFK